MTMIKNRPNPNEAFDDEFIAYLLELKWWNWDKEKIEANFEALSGGDLSLIREIKEKTLDAMRDCEAHVASEMEKL